MSYLEKGSLSIIHISILWRNNNIAAYIWKFNLGASEIDSYRGCAVGWPFRRENSNIRSSFRILHRGASFRIHGFSKKINYFVCYIRIFFLKKCRFRCVHLKILLLGLQKSTPLSRMRNWVAVSSREFEDPRILDRGYGFLVGIC